MKTKTKIKRKINKVLTQKRKEILILLLTVLCASFIGYNATGLTKELEVEHYTISIPKLLTEANREEVEMIDVNNGTIREISAYNAGDIAQTDDSPCISASGDDICKLLEKGEKICAANFVPLKTKLYIDNYGECTVLDRMNSRYSNRVDIAMRLDEKERAINFGIQKLLVINK